MKQIWIVIILLVIQGVWSGDWRVTFENQCFLRGSSAVIQCEYDYPSWHIATSVSWSKLKLDVYGRWGLSPLHLSPNHFEYVGNYKDCSLKVNNVQHSDAGQYYFSFKTTLNSWTSKASVHLSVKELTAVLEPSTVTEGQDVSLTCVSDCPTPPKTVWFRDGQPVTNTVFQAKREDSGRYYCAVVGQENVKSASVALNVQYAPHNVMLLMSPSRDIIKGSSLTFNCGSDANPPVTQSGYSLHKDKQLISFGQSHTISVLQSSDSGRYYCKAWNNISWRGATYFTSTEVHVDVRYRPTIVSVSMDASNVVRGSSVNLTCNTSANPAVHSYIWYKRAVSSNSSSIQVGSGQVLSLESVGASHTGFYLCHARNQLGENNSTEVLLTIQDKENGIDPLPVLAGIGVSLLVILVLALLFFWKKRKMGHSEKKQIDLRLIGSGTSSSATEDQSNSVYANVNFVPSLHPPAPVPHRSSQQDKSISAEDEVTYSTVTIKPRNPTLQRDIQNNKAPQDSRSNAGEKDEYVIYATVATSSS